MTTSTTAAATEPIPLCREARDTAVREAVALRRVRHPNVVRFRCSLRAADDGL